MRTWDGEEVVGQVIETRGDYALLEDAEAVAKFVRLDEKGEPRPCSPPMSLVRTLKDRKLRLRLPPLSGIVNCPSITVDGRVLDKPGYDPATGTLYDQLGVSFPPVPDFPDRVRAETAMARILYLLHTFDFETINDRAVALSLILSAIARRGLPFVPLHSFDAPVAGSGKSMVVDIASILATGHKAGVTAYGDPQEGEKRLSSVLMRGDPIIALAVRHQRL
jgi:putative DNA primase/helicase